MKLKIKNAFGIRNEITIDGEDKENMIIFGPNGSGKTSIQKTFKQVIDGNIREFGIEKDGNIDSLLLDGKNMEMLQDSKIFILSEENFIFNESNRIDPIKKFIEDSNVIDGLESFYNSYDNFTAEVWDEYSDDFNNGNPKETEIKELFTKEVNKQEFEKSLIYIKTLRDAGIPENINDTKNKLIVLYDDYENALLLEKIVKENKAIGLNKICLAIDEGSTGYEEKMKKAFPLMTNIKKNEMSEDFGYKTTDKFEAIIDIYEKISKDILSKGLPEKDLEVFLSNINLLEKYNVKKTIKSLKISDGILTKIKETEKVHASNILKNKSEYDISVEDLKKRIDDYLKEYNSLVEKVNIFIDSNDGLVWKLEVKKIKTPFDGFEVDIIQNGIKRVREEMKEYASAGQLRVVSLSLLLLNWDSYDLLVIDDVLSSLDFENSEIFVEMINKIEKPIIFLTHNFSIVSKLAYSNITNKSSIHIMDSIKDDKIISFEIKSWESIKYISEILSSSKVNKNLVIANKSMISSVLYEYVENYIQNNTWWENNKKSATEPQKYLYSVKEAINNNARHWRENDGSSLKLATELNNEDKNMQDIIFGGSSVFAKLLKGDSNELFVNYFINGDVIEKIENGDITNTLSNWLSAKYFIAMHTRQLIEKHVIEKYSDAKVKWNAGEMRGLFMYTLKKNLPDDCQIDEKTTELLKINNKLNFINHLNNLKWIPIFEFPIYKLLKYMEIALEKIKE